MRSLQKKRALITGAASGIGRALAETLATEGAHLLLVDCDAVGLAETAALVRGQGGEVATRVVDLAEPAAVTRLVEQMPPEFAQLDLLINNAGVVHYGPTAAMGADQLQRLLAVNLLAPLHLTRMLLPRLAERPEAHVVNVTSMYGYVATPRCAAYHASKFGLLGFSESLHVEYRGTSVGVTTVCPGFVSTKLFEHGSSRDACGAAVEVPRPPARLSTTPQHVARRIVRGIRRRERLVIITPLAWALYYTNRYAPWLLPVARWLHR
jgi:short-subunit dehydrogenase